MSEQDPNSTRAQGKGSFPEITCVGDAALAAEFENQISEEVTDRVQAFCTAFESGARGILDVVPTYRSVLVTFDPALISRRKVERLMRAAVRAAQAVRAEHAVESTTAVRDAVAAKFAAAAAADADDSDNADHADHADDAGVTEIPVCYGGTFGPDLEAVAAHAGLSKDEVVQRHAAPAYRICMLGFLPGFPYLSGLDRTLETPRLKTPRTAIPAGSVGIAGGQTGIYPLESPGGWQLIGRTPLRVYDSSREVPVPYRAGGRIRFVPISEAEFERLERAEEERAAGRHAQIDEASKNAAGNAAEMTAENATGIAAVNMQEAAAEAAPGIRFLRAGALTLVEDRGRTGHMESGIPSAGAMDLFSLRQANILVGNGEDEAGLECTLQGPEIEFQCDCLFAVTGADMQPELSGRRVQSFAAIPAKAGDVLRLGAAVSGLRTCIALRGGFGFPEMLGSRSTDMKSGLGGLNGRKILAGDTLPLRAPGTEIPDMYRRYLLPGQMRRFSSLTSGDCTGHGKRLARTDDGTVNEIRVTAGPQRSLFSAEELRKLSENEYTILPESDRMGIRFSGPAIRAEKGSTDIISDGIVFGAMQITAAGLPIVMMADHQTAGGYAKPCAVIAADLPRLAQLRPGERVRFRFVTLKEADRARRKQERLLRAFRREVT